MEWITALDRDLPFLPSYTAVFQLLPDPSASSNPGPKACEALWWKVPGSFVSQPQHQSWRWLRDRRDSRLRVLERVFKKVLFTSVWAGLGKSTRDRAIPELATEEAFTISVHEGTKDRSNVTAKSNARLNPGRRLPTRAVNVEGCSHCHTRPRQERGRRRNSQRVNVRRVNYFQLASSWSSSFAGSVTSSFTVSPKRVYRLLQTPHL